MSLVKDRIAAMKKIEDERKIEEGNKKLRVNYTTKKSMKLLSTTDNKNDFLVEPDKDNINDKDNDIADATTITTATTNITISSISDSTTSKMI